jgi:anti-sigma regulatory factor (Ser/Thr protein kinase)
VGRPRVLGRSSPTHLVRIELPCEPGAPRLARDALRRLPEIAPVLDDALLVASELVTNAVMHSGCAPGETITLEAACCGGCVRIAVRDPGHTDGIPASPEQPPAQGGLGLRLVSLIACHWGVGQPPGRLVWAELALA